MNLKLKKEHLDLNKMKDKKCPLCYKEVYSEFGKSCKLCGMALIKTKKEYCSKRCEKKHRGKR